MGKLLAALLCFIGLAVCRHSNRPMTGAEVNTMLKHYDVVPNIIDESENFDQLVVSFFLFWKYICWEKLKILIFACLEKGRVYLFGPKEWAPRANVKLRYTEMVAI